MKILKFLKNIFRENLCKNVEVWIANGIECWPPPNASEFIKICQKINVNLFLKNFIKF